MYRVLLFILLGAFCAAVSSVQAKDSAGDDLVWHEVTRDEIEGAGWQKTLAPFDRLPPDAEKTVPEAVWNLSHHSAGLDFRFVTDAPRFSVRWSLRNENLAMPHMPATGVSGVDLYARRKIGGGGRNEWRFVGVGQPRQQNDNIAEFAGGGGEYRLYLPLYNGVTKIEVGIPAGSFLKAAPPPLPDSSARQKPVVFYGTSITQGGCASRPGMAFTAIVGRHLDTPVVNLGFSGSGKMEQALAELLCQLNPSVIVLDCLRNMSEAEVAERVEPFVRRLRVTFPTVPILLAEDAFIDNPRETARGKLVRATVDKLTKEGVTGLHFLPMNTALGTDGEGTVDGVHPNDVGMLRLAEVFTDALRPLLK